MIHAIRTRWDRILVVGMVVAGTLGAIPMNELEIDFGSGCGGKGVIARTVTDLK